MKTDPRPRIDLPGTTLERVRILSKKRFLNRLYRDWYAQIVRELPPLTPGPVLELGSGAGFFTQVFADAVTSDILALPIVDMTLDAHRLPFRAGCLRAIVMVDVFHHLQDAARFLSEALRCLKPGGRIVMIEPWLTPWSRLVYRGLHHEPCRIDAAAWRLPPGGPLSQANSALPWIVFERDARRRQRRWPLLEVIGLRRHTPLRYLLSGGMRLPASMPAALFDAATRLESLLQPWCRWCAMFATIVVARREG